MNTTREIEFRAWHKQRKKMFVVLSMDVERKAHNGYGALRLIDEESSATFTVIQKDVELMQYTGFEIGNVKIYEDDLLEIGDEEEQEYEVVHVFFNTSTFSFDIRHSNTECQSLYDVSDNYSHISAIGNIHERPELFEEENES